MVLAGQSEGLKRTATPVWDQWQNDGLLAGVSRVQNTAQTNSSTTGEQRVFVADCHYLCLMSLYLGRPAVPASSETQYNGRTSVRGFGLATQVLPRTTQTIKTVEVENGLSMSSIVDCTNTSLPEADHWPVGGNIAACQHSVLLLLDIRLGAVLGLPGAPN